MNILATDKLGREYLFTGKDFVKQIAPLLTTDSSADLDNAVSILQKLTFIKDAKTQMIEQGVLEAALAQLRETQRLTPLAIAYAGTLVEALCTRKAAAKRCINNDALTTLIDLYDCELPQEEDRDVLRTSVTRALRSLFSIEPLLRRRAKETALKPMLEQKVKDDPSLAEHANEVIEAMEREGEDPEENDDDLTSDGEMFAAYDEVGDEEFDFPLEGEALLAKYVQNVSGSLSGSTGGRQSGGKTGPPG
jgi:hypothetical protein